MKTLILIRHAKSSWDTLEASDFDRSLNQRGRRDAPVMGARLAARLAAAGGSVDLLVSSSACRAEQTAQLLAPALGLSAAAIMWERKLYLASPAAMLNVIHALPDQANCVALLAHNPGITELAERLSDQWFSNVPTCGMVTLALPVQQWCDVHRRAIVINFDYPKKQAE